MYERLALTPEGERRWVRVHLEPDKDAAGEVRGLYSLVIDVDQDHRLREALQSQEARLRFFSENIPGPVAMVDANLRYVFVNKVFASLHGFTPDEVLGRHIREVIGEDNVRNYLMPRLERLRAGETCAFERLIGMPGG